MLCKRARQDHIDADLLDAEANRFSIKETIAEITRQDPDIVALVIYGQQPSASTQNMVEAELLSKELSSTRHQVLFIGGHPSSLPERTLRDNPWALVCKGEGPDTVNTLCHNKTYEDIPGLCWLEGHHSGGEFKSNKSAPLILDLAKNLPGMQWSRLNLSKYRTSNWHALTNNNDRSPFASIYTSLGCPYNCSFCCINSPFGGSSFRFWDPDFMIEQFRYLADQGIKNIKIADEMFILRPNHFLTLCELIVKNGFKFNIWAYSRIDTVKEKYLSTLKKAGINWLALGIESGSKEVRMEVTKGKFEDVNIRTVVKQIQSAGISVIANYIFGLPTDTIKSMEDTLNLSIELNTEFVNFYSTMPYPGSFLHISTEAKELPENNVGWIGYSQHSYETFNLSTEEVNRADILRFRDEAFHKYYNRSEYRDMIRQKFGQAQVDAIDNMQKISLKRKLYI
jgi:radical SAM superfamily enzyme YgiQ (UPF0313 family)